MHQARVLRATSQDVCIFCTFRGAFISRATTSQRRYIGSSSSLRRQNFGVAFKDEPEDSGFGGLADEVEATLSPPPPPPPPSSNREPELRRTLSSLQDDTKRYQGFGATKDRDLARQLHQVERRSPAPRIRRVNLLQRSEATPEAAVDRSSAGRWAIARRSPEEHPVRPPSDPYNRPSSQQAPTRSPSGAPPISFKRMDRGHSIRLESGQKWWQQPRPDPSYVSFDARANAAESEPMSQSFKTPAPRIPPLSVQHKPLPQEPVGWQPWPSTAPEPGRASPSGSSRDVADEGLSHIKQFTRSAAEPAQYNAPARQAFDEYGFPIESKASTIDEYVPQSSWQSTSARTNQPERGSRFGKKPGRYAKEEREVEDRRRDDFKKGRASRRDEDNDDYDVEEYHRRKRERQARKVVAREDHKAKADRRTIRLPDFIKVGVLATELQLRYGRFAQILEKYGFDDVNSDFVLSAENAALIAEEAGFNPITESSQPDDDLYATPLPEDMSVLPQRPPVVTIMGHVDHGKTTILDYMRKSSIVASEHGGITQHIGAFSVPMPSGKTITFLDTPGHAAFLSMRQRGANVTDIVILVVAADDSVMPQTLEAIKHAKAAQVPIIVAMNKIDKPEAKPDQVKQDLARHGVDIEDYGGDVQVVQVSGKTGQGMEDLEEAIIALSEIQDQRAPIDGGVEGWVLESSTKEAGKVATVLIRRGTLKHGDIIVAGTEYCRVRSMRDEFGNQVPQVSPGMPAEIEGWRGQPKAGDEVLQAPNEQVAHNVTHLRDAKLKKIDLSKDVEAINEQRKMHAMKHEREKAIERAQKAGIELPEETEEEQVDIGPSIKTVYFIVKGDVAGSVEAVVNSIAPLGNSEVRPIILKAGVGTITESDVDHATASGGQVISFNTAISPQMRGLAERAGTKILDHNIIYRLVDDVKASLEAMLPPLVKSKVLGEAEISQIFEINQKRKKLQIAGCKVRNGTILRNAKVKVLRGNANDVVYTGTFTSLKHVKKDVMEMGKGSECGMSFTDWQDFQPGDIAQCYEEWEEKRKL